MTDAEIAKLDKRMRERQAVEMEQCMVNARRRRQGMTIEGAYNILSDPAITEADDLPIAVKALIALALANQPRQECHGNYQWCEEQVSCSICKEPV